MLSVPSPCCAEAETPSHTPPTRSVIGPVIGGLAESPAKNHPNSYVGQLPLFKTYPYLFPCLLASTVCRTH